MPDTKPAPQPTLGEVFQQIRARRDNNLLTQEKHPDLGIQLKAQARAEAYGLVMGLLEPLLSQKEQEPRAALSSVCNGEFCTGCGNHAPLT